MIDTGKLHPEFCRLLRVDGIGIEPVRMEIRANPGERRALAERFGLRAIGRLSATLEIGPASHGNLIRVEGVLEADVTQLCVVTLAPVRRRLEATFRELFDAAPAAGTRREVIVEVDAEDAEPAGPEGIDLGEAVAQQLFLALDPYPRAPDADRPAEPAAGPARPAGEDGDDGPFAVLKSLRSGARKGP